MATDVILGLIFTTTLVWWFLLRSKFPIWRLIGGTLFILIGVAFMGLDVIGSKNNLLMTIPMWTMIILGVKTVIEQSVMLATGKRN